MSGNWQPIQTAPRDGTRIMLGYMIDTDRFTNLPRTGWIKIGRWAPNAYKGYDEETKQYVCAWQEDSVPETPINVNKLSLSPTHWMPLPEAPK